MTLTAEAVLDEVRHRLGPLNEEAERAVAEALEIIRKKIVPPVAGNFTSKNASLQEYLGWTDEQQRQYHSDAEEANAAWIEKKMRDLNANWLIVVDGEIIAQGPALRTFPFEEEFEALCDKLDKYPFVLFSPRMLLIEEATAWHPTMVPGDAYPTLALGLQTGKEKIEIEADLDTGAWDIYIDHELLNNGSVSSLAERSPKKRASHLGQNYNYVTKSIWLEIDDAKGQGRRIRTNAICVEDWRYSSFITINPERKALVGRDLLLQLQPQVLLDFAAHQTQVEYR